MRRSSGTGLRRGPVLAALTLAVGLSFATASAPSAAAEGCPNEARRAEQGTLGASLPDCRAYELVSPESFLTNNNNRPARASLEGDAFTFNTPFPAVNPTSSGYFYLSTREADGWSVRSVAPQSEPAANFEDECEANVFFSPRLTVNILEEGWFAGDLEPRCKRAQSPIVPGEPDPHRNVFVHDVATGAHRLVNLTPADATPDNAKFQDASDDFTRVVFSEPAQLTDDALAGYNFYLWADGVVRLFTVLPDGTPALGELVEATGARTKEGNVTGSGFAALTGAVSRDGERIFFYSGGNLYARLNADRPQSDVSGGECTEPALACTVQVDESQGSDPSGGGIFWGASDDGTRVFFTAASRLTADSTAASGKPDLYEFEVDTGQLTDLTANASEPADVKGVGGFGEEGEYVYFAANGALASGATPGNCATGNATGTACSLYVAHGGEIRLIARLAGADRAIWRGAATQPDLRRKPRNRPAIASPNGRYFAFASVESLTGYDNRAVSGNSPVPQVFLYDAEGDEGELGCVSCIPDGARPEFPAATFRADGNYGLAAPGGNASWATRAVLDDGSVLFDTPEGLLERDVNEFHDVYRYRDGELSLISSGVFPGPARFYDATPDGSDIFFRTGATLLPEDTDNENVSVYDARVGGGFPQPPPDPARCGEEECRGALPAPPPVTEPATSPRRRAGRKPRKQGNRRRCRRQTKGKRCARKKGRLVAAKDRGRASR